MLWANDQYYVLAGRSAEEHVASYSFYDAYLEEDLPKAEEVWNTLVAGLAQVNVELRMKRTYPCPTGEEIPAIIQALSFPYRDLESGQVKSIMACTTNISRLKWAQAFHARSAAEAREAKKRQEAFIDVVSHEMRNPLNAIVHCADAIIATAQDCESAGAPAQCLEALNENAQNAKIVLQCAKHQRRILDDVLTLSKLNSTLLSIKPVPVEPSNLINSVIDMFEPELDRNSIHLEVNSDASLSDLSIHRVFLDPSRVTQILINLLTNAIKLVKSSKEPSISIRLGACTSNPRSLFTDEMFWADGKPSEQATNDPEWGLGEHIYLTFTVQDSGIGLNKEYVAKIFRRFSQATIKTHITYSGSGLGLYISKELAEKQGGEIGVTSVPGQGATFGFYIKTRRAEEQSLTVTLLTKSIKQPEPMSPRLHVLLVEDNLISQQVLGKQLIRAGLIVEVANHGLEALQILERKTFDAVLMDSEMPILDGLAATRAIRQKELLGEGLLGSAMITRPGAVRLPIIAVTANFRDEQVQSALEAGSDDVVQKPFRVKDLIERIHSLLA
ncbi:uncharacterized protein EKO05_0003900 [Ascochyta rabiei]|uniref:uncharacterized protein n=1 Tax=Didymella rabiei TaxID=5454 RepID=UPI0021FAE989|nr:uncharacterized protein EKO05_0003900 [Ascochyta rabiei]UPX13391.1 hypothetical protein EKO05_0003900 [Ascochyta rabiei]